MVENTTNSELNKQFNNANIQGFDNSSKKSQFSDTEISNAYNNTEIASSEPATSYAEQNALDNQHTTGIQATSVTTDILNVQNNANTVDSTSEVNCNQNSVSENPVNCLSLTVRKDYSLSVVKHVLVRTWKTTWRVALSIFLLNFLSFFF